MAFLVLAYIVFFLSIGQFCVHSFQPKNVLRDIIKVKNHVVFPGIKSYLFAIFILQVILTYLGAYLY